MSGGEEGRRGLILLLLLLLFAIYKLLFPTYHQNLKEREQRNEKVVLTIHFSRTR